MRPTVVFNYIGNLCKNGKLDEAIVLMEQHSIPVSRDNAYHLLQECSKRRDLQYCRRVETLLVKAGLDSVEVLGNHLIRISASCGYLIDANQVFNKVLQPSVYTWSAIVAAHADLKEGEAAIQLYIKMQESDVKNDRCVYLGVLKACVMITSLRQVRKLHDQIIEDSLGSDVILASTLVDAYAKCGSLEESSKLFSNLPNRNVVTWNAIIAGYVQQNENVLALNYFNKMHEEGLKPTAITFLTILKACGNIGAIEQGRAIHDQILRYDMGSDILVGSSLIDMYAKSGSLEESRRLFETLHNRDVVLWSAMIGGYAQHGKGFLALECFEQMQGEGIKPDKITLLSLLIACSRAGLVDRGTWYFENMLEQHGVAPDADFHNCMVDLLGRAGFLKEAEYMLQASKHLDVSGWKALLSACRVHGNLDIGRFCFNEIMHLDPHCGPGYVLMSNMYADMMKM